MLVEAADRVSYCVSITFKNSACFELDPNVLQ